MEPTYKGLKREELEVVWELEPGLEPTYKGLKPAVQLAPFPARDRVWSLPIRD